MLFTDKTVLVDKSSDGMNVKLERSQKALKSKGIKIIHTKRYNI